MSGIPIKDGKGTGILAHVDKEHRVHTLAVTQAEMHHVSRNDQESYATNLGTTVANTLTLTATIGALLLIRNDSTTEDLVIQTIRIGVSAAGTVFFFRRNDAIGTIADNKVEIPRNLNFKSGNVADATVYAWDEVNNGLGGLTAGQYLHLGEVGVGTTPFHINGAYHLGKDNNLVIGSVLGTPEATVSVDFYFESTDFD